MTINEFKAWLEGFSEAVGEAPTPDQWGKIKAKIADLVPFAPAPAPTVFPHPMRNPSPILPPWTTTSYAGTRAVDAVSGRDLGSAD